MIDFQDFTPPESPNYYYVAPKDFSKVEPHNQSPSFNLPVDELNQYFKKMIATQPRVKLLSEDNYQFAYVQRTRFLQFPDYIDVKLIGISQSQSTLAIYSRSKYGYYDFGANKKRVSHWLNELELIVADGNSNKNQ